MTPPEEQQKTTLGLSYEDFCDLYSQAEDVFSWYYLGLMELDTTQEIRNDYGCFYRCIDKRLPENCNLEGLETYLQQWFSKDFVSSLLQNTVQFVEKDGVLYAAGNGCGTNPSAGKERISENIEKLNNTKVRLTVYVEELGWDLKPTGEKEYCFDLVIEDGRWVFLEFELVR